jgi:4-hydroxybenzoate polyprenyltransferase/phosphoserine phosphatase
MSTILQSPASVATERPLCVDLDGTLVKSDTLHDSLLALVRTHPLRALRLPVEVMRGKAAFKSFVTRNIDLDVAHLPYNRALLDYLQEEAANGRPIYLATGADTRLAQRVADHLGIFAGVLGSDGRTNLTGNHKLDRLRDEFDCAEFDYIGNATPDLTLLQHSTEPMVANPTPALRRKLKSRGIQPARSFEEGGSKFKSIVRALRVHQWAKNALLYVPLLLSHQLQTPRLLAAVLAFACFSASASATYILNDLLDIEADRRHPRKQRRPFASGDLSAVHGMMMAAVLLLVGLAGAAMLPAAFYGWLLLYLAITIAYSSYLKSVALVDVLVLSGLYTLRLVAGAAATDTPISPWLAGFSIFLFLSLAFVKRFAELESLRIRGLHPHNGRAYLVADLPQLRSFGTASAYAAVVIFAIYTSGIDVTALYAHPARLWMVVPFMLLWLSRVWLLASRGELNEDPVIFAMTDRMSLLIGAAVAAIVFAAI